MELLRRTLDDAVDVVPGVLVQSSASPKAESSLLSFKHLVNACEELIGATYETPTGETGPQHNSSQGGPLGEPGKDPSDQRPSLENVREAHRPGSPDRLVISKARLGDPVDSVLRKQPTYEGTVER